jgi:hypothetical protein
MALNSLDPNISSRTSISSVRMPIRYVYVPEEGNVAITTAARGGIDGAFVDESEGGEVILEGVEVC